MDGILNIYKEKGYTSHDVVAKLRGILKQKKIGHTGTLDPDAEGVLPVCLGNATKLCDLLTDKDKTYEAVLKLGVTTDTQDLTGTIIKECKVDVDVEDIRTTIMSFVGDYNQIPPMYSALKVNGRKLYELAREGIEIERKSRLVHIYEIEILSIDETLNEISMSVTCSKGTYIRTLCHDIGELLGCGGSMKNLLRTKVSQFNLMDSLTLSQVSELKIEDKLEPHILKVEDMFPDYGKVIMLEEFNKLVYNGNLFHSTNIVSINDQKIGDTVRVYDSNNRFVGIYAYLANQKQFKPIKMFL